MNVLENFKDLFLEIWQQGIAGVNFTQIGLAIAIFLFFTITWFNCKIYSSEIKELCC